MKITKPAANEDRAKPTARSRSTQARGRARRRILLDAARSELDERDIGDVTLQGIAGRANIPLSSAYHFYENKSSLFAALAAELGGELAEILADPYPGDQINTWEDIVDDFIDRGVAWCSRNRCARQLLIGGKTSPEIKLAGRINDKRLSENVERAFAVHFELPSLPNRSDKFFYFTEIVDLMLSLSQIYHGRITDEMVNEAKIASKAYLGTFLPKIVPRRTQPVESES